MKFPLILLLVVVIAFISIGCDPGRSLEIKKSEQKLTGLTLPTPVSHRKGEAKVVEIINKTFTRCPNDAGRDLTYAFTEGKYLLEIQDLKYNNGFWSSIFGLSPVELSADETWKSGAYFRAEVTGKCDIYKYKWEYREGKPNDLKFEIKRVEGKWVCEGCEQFEAVPCAKVQEILNRTPRYKNNDE